MPPYLLVTCLQLQLEWDIHGTYGLWYDIARKYFDAKQSEAKYF